MFDVYDEYINVIHPKMIHIAHDEWWAAPLEVCPRCKGKDYSELYAYNKKNNEIGNSVVVKLNCKPFFVDEIVFATFYWSTYKSFFPSNSLRAI